MHFPPVTDLIPVLQIAIGPVILISGAGLILLSMTNRLGRAIDRARALKRDLPSQTPADQGSRRTQLNILQRRAQLLRVAIILTSVSILLAALLIISLFFVALLHWDAAWLILLLFIGCLGALIGAMLAFIQDVNQALLALQVELGEQSTEGSAS